MDARGETLVPVDREQVAGIVADLIGSGVESLTISLINAYVDGRHEREIAALVEELPSRLPRDDLVRRAARVPRVRAHADRVHELLRAPAGRRLRRPAAVLAARARRAVRARHPALRRRRHDAARGRAQPGLRRALRARAAASPARCTSRRAPGFPNVLTFDMGGTSTDVSLCQAGEPTIGRETSIGQFRDQGAVASTSTRSAPAAARSRTCPSSRARCASGPESAGAEPGPAAYGRGGEAPTVTDANVVVGHLPPRLHRRRDGARRRRRARRGRQGRRRRSGCRSTRPPRASSTIVNENMAGALRVISVQRGHDPREFALVAFGGAGPLHANAVAELMGSFPVIVPPSPGLLCALGDLVADFRSEFAQTLIRLTRGDERRRGRRRSAASSRGARGRGWTPSRSRAEQQSVTFVADMRYHGQGYEIPVPLERDLAVLDERFNALHEQLYGFRMPDTASEIVNLRAIGVAARPSPELPHGHPDGGDAGRDARDLFERERGPRRSTTAARLHPGHRLTRAGDRDRVRLDDGRAARLRGRGGRVLQHPDPAGGARMSTRELRSRRRSRTSTSTRSRWTSSRTRCGTRASRWTRCCSAAR